MEQSFLGFDCIEIKAKTEEHDAWLTLDADLKLDASGLLTIEFHNTLFERCPYPQFKGEIVNPVQIRVDTKQLNKIRKALKSGVLYS